MTSSGSPTEAGISLPWICSRPHSAERSSNASRLLTTRSELYGTGFSRFWSAIGIGSRGLFSKDEEIHQCPELVAAVKLIVEQLKGSASRREQNHLLQIGQLPFFFRALSKLASSAAPIESKGP